MQTALFGIWTRIAESTSYDDNLYFANASKYASAEKKWQKYNKKKNFLYFPAKKTYIWIYKTIIQILHSI